jgi:ubiquinone/menaquinone biosynthesis C-methylase UbiE
MCRTDFFNKAASDWDKRFVNQNLTLFLETFVEDFGLEKGQNILDAGTGTGILIPFLLKAIGPKGHITAIDCAEKMIEICRTKYRHIPNVTFKVEDLEKTSLPSESFDAAVCFGLFPHLEHKKLALKQLNRVLKPAGKLVIAHALSSAEIKTHHANMSPIIAHDIMPPESQMKRMLRETGFTKIQIIDKPGCYLCKCSKC